ncbi:serine hydrolase domain-containing protein [Niabella beijingensis]|uniref:serine hydrolase domain-containing protein n=1 Tax=Niabella beijingensis TaxID=2872700 RepID=UPI001CBD87DF|nr:serine hydrolase domain-containing protein [Niabella beijingensis]MBZ4189155.1 beta-lactamase family protein [Niabella beijingensis]
MIRFSYMFIIWVTLFFSCGSSKPVSEHRPVKMTDSTRWNTQQQTSFEKRLEKLRRRYHIPGISAGIVNEGQLVWKKGFGYADVEKKILPDEHTVYQIASVTKTFGAILLMQQAEAGKLSLEDPVNKYGINLGARWGSDPRIKLKHLMTHTAMGTSLNGFRPGYVFRYNGGWYGALGKAIEKASGRSFGALLREEITIPLNMKNTVPSTDDSAAFALMGYDKASFLKKVALPYDWKHRKLQPVQFRYGFNPGAGIMSNVTDLALYAVAIDERRFLSDSSWQRMLTPYTTPKGKTIQYGLGWFVKYYKGVKVIWHTGWWTGYSALFVKIPEKDLTLILLANSQDLSRPFYHIVKPIPGLGLGFFNPFRRNLNKTVKASKFAAAFLKYVAD